MSRLISALLATMAVLALVSSVWADDGQKVVLQSEDPSLPVSAPVIDNTSTPYASTLVSLTPGSTSGVLSMHAGDVITCTAVFQNTSSIDWSTNPVNSGYVELRSVDGTRTNPFASPLACNWLNGSAVSASTAQTTIFDDPSRAASLGLHWTAPGDDGLIGQASSYDIRYSLQPMTADNWYSAPRFSTSLVPSLPGQTDSVRITGLLPSTTYQVGVRTADEVPNWSDLSNIVTATTGTTQGTFTFTIKAPAVTGRYVLNLALYNPSSNSYLLSAAPATITVDVIGAPSAAYGLILRNPATANWYERTSVGNAFAFPSGPNSPADLWLGGWAQDNASYTFTSYVGDLNGDGYDDLIVERNDCNWYVAWNNRNGSFTNQNQPILSPWGTSPSPGKYFFWFTDVTGDHKDDLLTYDASNGNWYVSQFNTTANTFDPCQLWLTWGGGIGVFQPLVGDWNGDGKKDICLRNPTTGQHYVRLSSGAGFYQGANDSWLAWGASPDFQPLVGDWNGDGKDDLCLFNASTGDWWIRTSNGSAFVMPSGSNTPPDRWQTGWTGAGDIPFVGDFNGDGKTDIALRDPSTGNHWVRKSNGLSFTQPSPDNWLAGWGASASFQLLTGRFGNGVGGSSAVQPAASFAHLQSDDRPVSYGLAALGPQPFHGQTEFAFSLPADGQLRVAVYDIGGRRVTTMVDAWTSAGIHRMTWKPEGNLGSGIYFVRMTVNAFTTTRKTIFLGR